MDTHGTGLETAHARCADGAPRRAPRRSLLLATLLLTTYALVGATCERAVRTVQIGGTFSSPIFAAAPVGDARLFVVERAGVIRIIDANGSVLPTPFLDITSKVGTSGEAGLLGLAFPANYASTGQFYVYYLNTAGDSVLSRFLRSTGNPNVASTTERIILTIDQPAGRTNHKGGTIAFSPVDGMLYWGLGDGGSGNDPDNLAQNGTTLLGKMLRLNVSGGPTSGYTIPSDNPFASPTDGVQDLIWSLGWRNPFRWSFDRELGDMWVGDVGQGAREEVDFESSSDAGGRNYGWVVHEGTLCNIPQPGNPCETPQTANRFTFPTYEYTNDASTCAITGGVVYRGSVPFLRGAYLFSDYCSNKVWSIGGVNVVLQDLTARLRPTNNDNFSGIVAFGEDGFGEVILVNLNSGKLYKIQ